MLLNHDITLDLLSPGQTPRIQIKQGDTFSHNICITLTAGGEPWLIPDDTTAVIRYRHCDPESLTVTQGIFDTLEDGSCAWVYGEDLLEVMPPNALMQAPGLITLDVLLLYKDRALATFDFELYVNRAPAAGSTVTQALADYYRVASLEQINEELDRLRAAIEDLGGTVD